MRFIDGSMVFSAIERTTSMNEDNTLRIPVEPVVLPCDECQGEAYPNYRYELVGMSGVLCKPCLNKELATINAALKSEQSQEPGNEDVLEAVKKPVTYVRLKTDKNIHKVLNYSEEKGYNIQAR